MKLKHALIYTAGIAAAILLIGGSHGTKAGPAYLYPDPQRTPGALNPAITQANIADTICNPKWSTASIRPGSAYTTSLKKQQLSSGYAVSGDTKTGDYEEDHFISLELGGAPTDVRNLWPESYVTLVGSNEIGAREKDIVENYLHREVCNGALTLKQAQDAITADWYKIYFTITNPGSIGGSNTDD